MKPVRPTDDTKKDIAAVKKMLSGRRILGKTNTCLDPSLYDLKRTGAKIRLFRGKLNELAPAIINDEAEATILDVPDALIALEKWPGKIKVIGPVSPQQKMGCAFAKSSPYLHKAFDEFFEKFKKDGRHARLVKKYYPAAFRFYGEFFRTVDQLSGKRD